MRSPDAATMEGEEPSNACKETTTRWAYFCSPMKQIPTFAAFTVLTAMVIIGVTVIRLNGDPMSNMANYKQAMRSIDDKWNIPKGAGISNFIRAKYPQINIRQCVADVNAYHTDDCEIKFAAPNTFPLVQLLSFPGSGNTWVRFLLEQYTGYFTGSEYDDIALFRGGLCGEVITPDDGSVLGIKGHHISKLPVERVVLIMRNPYNAIISEYKRRQTRSHVKNMNVTLFFTEEWRDYLPGAIKTWKAIHLAVLNIHQRVLIIHYEDLIDHVFETVDTMAEFVVPSGEFREQCILENREGNFRRDSQSCDETEEVFDDDMIDMIDQHIRSVALAFDALGMKLPEYEPEPVCTG